MTETKTVIDQRYLLHEEIGRGGFGVVHRATRLADQKAVAIKLFNPAKSNRSNESLERFKREGQSGMKLHHKNAVQVFDTGISPNRVAFIVMELLHGRSLEDELEEKGTLPETTTLNLCADVCDALAAAHELQIVHRDIKPDNVFLHHDEQGEPVTKVLDLGVAKLSGDALPKLTATGAVVGTPTYVAPERFRGEPFDGRSDVFSVGVLIFRCLTNELPFAGNTKDFLTVVSSVLNDEPRLQVRNNALRPELQGLLARLLSKDPDERPTAAELAQTLRQLAAQLS